MGKGQYIRVHAINTGDQHRRGKHAWQDRESTNRVVLFCVNESRGGIEQESYFLEQERIMFHQRANILT